jgi:hypothetical protein
MRSSSSNKSCRRRLAQVANGSFSSCARPCSLHNFFFRRWPAFIAKACSRFVIHPPPNAAKRLLTIPNPINWMLAVFRFFLGELGSIDGSLMEVGSLYSFVTAPTIRIQFAGTAVTVTLIGEFQYELIPSNIMAVFVPQGKSSSRQPALRVLCSPAFWWSRRNRDSNANPW